MGTLEEGLPEVGDPHELEVPSKTALLPAGDRAKCLLLSTENGAHLLGWGWGSPEKTWCLQMGQVPTSAYICMPLFCMIYGSGLD